jgi:hypothetical protein
MGMFGKGAGEFFGEWFGNFGRVGHLVEGAGKILPEMAKTMPWLAGAAKTAGTVGESPIGKAMGPVGAILSGVSGAINVGEAVSNFEKGGYHCDKAWNNVGGGILGGAGAAMIACPVAGAYLAAGEGAADIAGHAAAWGFGKKAGFSADNMVGGLARGMFGDRSVGEDVSNALGGGFWGHAAGTATNVLASPVTLATTIGGGIVDEMGAIGSGIMNGEGVIGGGLNAIGSGIGDAASAVGSGIGDAASAVADW